GFHGDAERCSEGGAGEVHGGVFDDGTPDAVVGVGGQPAADLGAEPDEAVGGVAGGVERLVFEGAVFVEGGQADVARRGVDADVPAHPSVPCALSSDWPIIDRVCKMSTTDLSAVYRASESTPTSSEARIAAALRSVTFFSPCALV